MHDFGEKLHTARVQRGWSRERLAVALDVSSQTIYRWETSKALPQAQHQAAIRSVFPDVELSIDVVPAPMPEWAQELMLQNEALRREVENMARICKDALERKDAC